MSKPFTLPPRLLPHMDHASCVMWYGDWGTYLSVNLTVCIQLKLPKLK